MVDLPFEQFPALSAIGICRHAFAQRIPGIDVSHDKVEVLKRLDAAHRGIRNAIGIGDWPLFTAQQIHGNKIAVVDEVGSARRVEPIREFPGCDGITTNQRGIVLGVYVADCCAVYIVDSKTPAIGLVHSGRKGSALGVKEIHDSGICTACDLDRYYSYRAEKGKTGRMLAVFGLNPTIAN